MSDTGGVKKPMGSLTQKDADAFRKAFKDLLDKYNKLKNKEKLKKILDKICHTYE